MSSKPQQIAEFLQARLTRCLALGVLIALVLIELSLLVPATLQYEQNRLDEIKQSTLNASALTMQALPQNLEGLELLQSITTRFPEFILGGSLYEQYSGDLIGNFGEIPRFNWLQAQRTDSLRQGDRYDIALPVTFPTATGADRPYLLILRQDISQVPLQRRTFIWHGLGRIAVIALALTLGIMLLLGITVITPILDLRRNLHQLLQAVAQGETPPSLAPSPAQPSHELGDVIEVCQQISSQVVTATQARQSVEKELRALNEQLEQRVLERTQALDEKNQSLLKTLLRLEAAQDALVESERQDALGQLVAGIAHELNTPLGAMQASAGNLLNDLQTLPEVLPFLWSDLAPEDRLKFVELLERASTSPASLSARDRRQQRKHLENKLALEGVQDTREVADLCLDLGIQTRYEPYLPLLTRAEGNWCRLLLQQVFQLYENSRTIRTAVGRASKIVFALKSYAQGNLRESRAAIDLTHSIYSALSLYPSQLRSGVKLTRNYENLPIIWGYPNALMQVWANLFHNALQAIEGQGEIILTAQVEAEFVVVRIEDSGPGIPVEIQERIFEPFFTTRSPGEGSGLGLGLCRQVVEKHGGDLTMTSQPGQTIFTVRLPLSLPGDDP